MSVDLDEIYLGNVYLSLEIHSIKRYINFLDTCCSNKDKVDVCHLHLGHQHTLGYNSWSNKGLNYETIKIKISLCCCIYIIVNNGLVFKCNVYISSKSYLSLFFEHWLYFGYLTTPAPPGQLKFIAL